MVSHHLCSAEAATVATATCHAGRGRCAEQGALVRTRKGPRLGSGRLLMGCWEHREEVKRCGVIQTAQGCRRS